MSSKARKASSGQSSSSNRFRFCGFRVRSSSFIQTNRNGAVALTPENGEMQQPSCFSEPTAVLFLLYRGEKGPKRGTLSVSWVFRGLRTSGQGVAPTPHHLLKKVDENFWDYLRQPVVLWNLSALPGALTPHMQAMNPSISVGVVLTVCASLPRTGSSGYSASIPRARTRSR